jgi:hypothetical protein
MMRAVVLCQGALLANGVMPDSTVRIGVVKDRDFPDYPLHLQNQCRPLRA